MLAVGSVFHRQRAPYYSSRIDETIAYEVHGMLVDEVEVSWVGGKYNRPVSGLRLNYAGTEARLIYIVPMKNQLLAWRGFEVRRASLAHNLLGLYCIPEMSQHFLNCMGLISSRKREFVKKITYKLHCSPVPVK